MCHPSPVTVSKPASQQRTPDFVLVSLTRCSFKGIVRLKRGRMLRFFVSYAAAAGPLCSLHPLEFEWDRWEEWRKTNQDGIHVGVFVFRAQLITATPVSRTNNTLNSAMFQQYSGFPKAPLDRSPHLIRQNNRGNLLFKHFLCTCFFIIFIIYKNEWISYHICYLLRN